MNLFELISACSGRAAEVTIHALHHDCSSKFVFIVRRINYLTKSILALTLGKKHSTVITGFRILYVAVFADTDNLQRTTVQL